ncbi:hypothetical protein [Thermococcus sp.]
MNRELFLFLSHDVDWPRHGPGIKHILSRKDRFSEEVVDLAIKKKSIHITISGV